MYAIASQHKHKQPKPRSVKQSPNTRCSQPAHKQQRSRPAKQEQEPDTSEDEILLTVSSSKSSPSLKRFPNRKQNQPSARTTGDMKPQSKYSSTSSITINTTNLTRKASQDSAEYILPDTPRAKKSRSIFVQNSNKNNRESKKDNASILMSSPSSTSRTLQRKISNLSISGNKNNRDREVNDILDSSFEIPPQRPYQREKDFDSSFDMPPIATKKSRPLLSPSLSSRQNQSSFLDLSYKEPREGYADKQTKSSQTITSTRNKKSENALQNSNKINQISSSSFLSSSSTSPSSKSNDSHDKLFSIDIYRSNDKDKNSKLSSKSPTFSPSKSGYNYYDDDTLFGAETRKLVAMGHPICPFCDEPLPLEQSTWLKKQLKRLKRHPMIRPRLGSFNPEALSVPAHDSISYCRQHRNETTIIPKGRERGWPKKEDIDWDKLPERIRINAVARLKQIINGRKESPFELDAKREWSKKGPRQMRNIFNELETFEKEIPGYYGERGFEVIMNALESIFSLDMPVIEKRAPPLSTNAYFRRILVPETALVLIQEDLNCQRSTAIKILEESRDYGVALFGADEGDEDCSDTYDEDSKRTDVVKEDKEDVNEGEDEEEDSDDGDGDDSCIRILENSIELDPPPSSLPSLSYPSSSQPTLPSSPLPPSSQCGQRARKLRKPSRAVC